MTMDSIQSVEHYFAADTRAAELRMSTALRAAATTLVGLLPDADPVVLLARTEAALLVCGATAVLRAADTRVEPAPIGREGWRPPAGAILVEPVAPSSGLLRTLSLTLPSVRVLVLDPVSTDADRAPVSAAA